MVKTKIDELKEKLFKITSMIGDLTNNNDEIDQLGELVEKELSGMDKAIEEVHRLEVSFELIFFKIRFLLSRLLKESLICCSKRKIPTPD